MAAPLNHATTIAVRFSTSTSESGSTLRVEAGVEQQTGWHFGNPSQDEPATLTSVRVAGSIATNCLLIAKDSENEQPESCMLDKLNLTAGHRLLAPDADCFQKLQVSELR
jgi:hypothetical protein